MFDHHADRDAELAREPAAPGAASPAVRHGTPLLTSSSVAGQHATQDWIVAAARRAVAAIAPRELAVFTTMANLWLAAADGPRHARPASAGPPAPRSGVGYRINTVLFTELVFPVISGALSEILGNSTRERLTIDQAGALQDACQRHALAAGLPSITAAGLAAAVVAGPVSG